MVRMSILPNYWVKDGMFQTCYHLLKQDVDNCTKKGKALEVQLVNV